MVNAGLQAPQAHASIFSDLPRSATSVVNYNKGYMRNVDHKVFACSDVPNGHRTTTSTASAKQFLFLSDLPRSATSVVCDKK